MKPRFKPFDRPDGEDVWYCHPTLPTAAKRSSSKVRNKALSQVPDLNNDKDCSYLNKDESKKYMKRAIHTNDTKYIRLAKAGGRKHLLSFVENFEPSKSPQPYPVPSWFYHVDRDTTNGHDKSLGKYSQRPEWMIYPETIENTERQDVRHVPKQGIIAWDKMSTWKRDEYERQMKVNTKNIYEKKKKKQEKQHKTVKTKSKVNTDDTWRKDGKLKLPEITKTQFPGFRKLSGTELATNWYKKWYLLGKA